MKKKNKILIIVIMFLIVFSGAYYTYSQYRAKISGNVYVNAAIPIIKNNLDSTFSLSLDDFYPGYVKEVNFYINNFENDTKINEVKMKYDIIINKSNNLPVTVNLYKNGSTENCLENNESLNNMLIFGEKQTDSYRLVINWESSLNDEKYQDLSDYFEIYILGSQVV